MINADALKDRLQEALDFQEKHDNYEGAELFEIAQDIVDEQPTIPAIPVEWLEKKRKYASKGDSLDVGIAEVLDMWEKEQEVQDG